jgi:3-hydroxyacyl-[acyl-carrier-protein] dehydratase
VRKDLIIDFSEYDVNHVIADLEEIRRYNPQRYEMEQITAVVCVDEERGIFVGYKDYGPDEFWMRGHMPGMPVLPGVLICEAAAQLCSYCALKYDLLGCKMIGFGGMDKVRFREPVWPGQRLVIACKLLKLRRGAMIVCRFQAFVHEKMVCEGQFKGVPLPDDWLSHQPAT